MFLGDFVLRATYVLSPSGRSCGVRKKAMGGSQHPVPSRPSQPLPRLPPSPPSLAPASSRASTFFLALESMDRMLRQTDWQVSAGDQPSYRMLRQMCPLL